MERLEVRRMQRSFERKKRKRIKVLKDGTVREWRGKIWVKVDPITEITITPAPYIQNFLYILLWSKNPQAKALINKYLNRCVSKCVGLIVHRTGGEVEFVSRHSNTNNLHLNFEHCAIEPDSTRISDRGLGLAGPATSGYYRHCCLKAITDENRERLRGNLAKYRERAKAKGINTNDPMYNLPLDVQLGALVDHIAEQDFGNDHLFPQSKRIYIDWLHIKRSGDHELLKKFRNLIKNPNHFPAPDTKMAKPSTPYGVEKQQGKDPEVG